jgi:predicted HAD superfamily Cof-like phosphohydrolase
MNTELMSEHQRRVAEFMAKAGQAVPDSPVIPSEDVRRLRARLILEEALETIAAFGCGVFLGTCSGGKAEGFESLSIDDLVIHGEGDVSLVEIADGCADIMVVTQGALLACGIADKPIIEAVDASNMAKFGPGGYRREDGKWMKPPGWEAPDIVGLICDQICPPQLGDDDDIADDPTDVFVEDLCDE